MALASGCCHPHPPLSHQICRRRSVLVQPTRNNSLENEDCPVLEKSCLPWTLSLPRRPPPTLCFAEGPRSPSPEKARMGCERGPQSPRRAWSLHILLLFMLLAMKDKEEGIWGTPSRATVVFLLRCLVKRCPSRQGSMEVLQETGLSSRLDSDLSYTYLLGTGSMSSASLSSYPPMKLTLTPSLLHGCHRNSK